MPKILMLLTSYDRLLNGEQTGLWLEEFAVPYLLFRAAAIEVDIVSVSGGPVPVDSRSLVENDRLEGWKEATELLKNTRALTNEKAENYDAVFLPGGHGTAFDLPYNKLVHRLLFGFAAADKVIACLCHAPAVFAGMRAVSGKAFVEGRQVTGFTNAEEEAVGGTDKVPFLLESRLRELGAIYSSATLWGPHVVEDGKLLTGQNPQSSAPLAEKVIAALELQQAAE